MAKVRTFSRYFPAGHIRAGQPTFFVEKIYKSLYLMKVIPKGLASSFNFAIMNDDDYKPKGHTIRSGKHFKSGDFISPRIWTGKPYASKQIAIAPDIELVKVFDFKLIMDIDVMRIMIDHRLFYQETATMVTQPRSLQLLAQNDGLTVEDFKSWFSIHPKKNREIFDGQILCWDKNIEY